jgi:hypothetical protein
VLLLFRLHLSPSCISALLLLPLGQDLLVFLFVLAPKHFFILLVDSSLILQTGL